jgi:small-conductance mechanosensitive channel
MAMNFMRLDAVVMSGDGYDQSMAYHAYLNLAGWSFWGQCLYCLLCLAAAYSLAPRLADALWHRRFAGWQVTLVRDAGPALVATGLMAAMVGGCLAWGVPLYEQLVVWKVMSLTLWVLAVRLGSWLLREVMQPHELLRFMLRSIEWGLVLSMVLTFFGLLRPLAAAVSAVQFSVGGQVFKGANILGGLSMAVVALTLAGQFTQLINWCLMRYSARQHMMSNDALVLSRLMGLTIFLLTIIAVLVGAGIEPATLAAFAGALGIGLGFGLQEVVINFVSGISLLLERAIKPGDHVTVGAITGQVVQLGPRSLVIRDALGTENLIPNTTLTRGIVQNRTLSNADFRVGFSLRLADIGQYEQARRLIEQAMRAHPRVLSDRPTACQITAIHADEVTLELSCWINDLHNGQSTLVSDLLLQVGTSCLAHGIALARSPQSALWRRPAA